ncbi:hypothetical protein BT63DRAFT_145367 [Microthyrium microscopicum]|uniref:Uncharacterized protein n=1 Tax=Microthyrium microscopicum TaxID=703497 RepID=A0A6A6UQ57_9PEZI|nr:hypothetical protein BT63DRAFT_145367 [Microthyrium microscopicum]
MPEQHDFFEKNPVCRMVTIILGLWSAVAIITVGFMWFKSDGYFHPEGNLMSVTNLLSYAGCALRNCFWANVRCGWHCFVALHRWLICRCCCGRYMGCIHCPLAACQVLPKRV